MKLDSFTSLLTRASQSAMLYGAVGTFVRVGANVLLLPIILKKLSTQELALWWVFLALGGIASLADFGFGAAIARVYSYLWAGADDFETEGLRATPTHAAPNLPRIRQLNTTVRVLYERLAWGATILLAVAGSAFLYRQVQGAERPLVVWLAWAGYLLTTGYSLGTSHWSFACQGTNQMRALQATFMWSGLVYLVSGALLLMLGCGLFSLVLASAIRGVLARLLAWQAFHRVVPAVPGDSPVPERSMLKRLWPNARKFGVLSVAAYLIFNSSVLISSHLLGDASTASYGLTAQVGTFLTNFAALWLTVKWPEITILRTQGRLQEMAVLFARRLAWMMATYILIAVVLVLLGDRLLEWRSTTARLLPTSLLIVYLLYLAQLQFYVQFGMLVFTENVVPFVGVSLLTAIVLVALSLVMTPRLGLWGLTLAPLIATLACSSWYHVWRGFRGQPLTVAQFTRAAIYGRL